MKLTDYYKLIMKRIRLITEGIRKACKELSRILAVNGNLYFSFPVEKQGTYFNVHRVYSPKAIIEYFNGLKLVELSGVMDSASFIENVDMDSLENSKYAFGLFSFRK